MSYCKKEGKDEIIFATKEDMAAPSKAIVILDEDEEDHQPGLILPNGDINWDCPCLGGMATGPCGVEFRTAFSCFHYSKADPKGSDCYDAFLTMQNCMSGFPELYPPAKAPLDEKEDDIEEDFGSNVDVDIEELLGQSVDDADLLADYPEWGKEKVPS